MPNNSKIESSYPSTFTKREKENSQILVLIIQVQNILLRPLLTSVKNLQRWLLEKTLNHMLPFKCSSDRESIRSNVGYIHIGQGQQSNY